MSVSDTKWQNESNFHTAINFILYLQIILCTAVEGSFYLNSLTGEYFQSRRPFIKHFCNMLLNFVPPLIWDIALLSCCSHPSIRESLKPTRSNTNANIHPWDALINTLGTPALTPNLDKHPTHVYFLRLFVCCMSLRVFVRLGQAGLATVPVSDQNCFWRIGFYLDICTIKIQINQI